MNIDELEGVLDEIESLISSLIDQDVLTEAEALQYYKAKDKLEDMWNQASQHIEQFE